MAKGYTRSNNTFISNTSKRGIDLRVIHCLGAEQERVNIDYHMRKSEGFNHVPPLHIIGVILPEIFEGEPAGFVERG